VSEHIIALHRRRSCPALARACELLDVPAVFTQYARHGEELAAALPSDASLLVVAGGDGTLSEVVNGLMQRPAHQRPAILLIPGGSGNDAARMLGLRSRAEDVQRRFRMRQLAAWDVLRAELKSPLQEPITRYCINVMSAGITAEVAQLYNRSMRRLPPDIGYTLAALLTFSRYQPGHVRLRFGGNVEGESVSQELLLVALANNRWFGSGIGVAPHALPDDGQLALTIAAGVRPLQFLGMLPRLRRAQYSRHPGIAYRSSDECHVDSDAPIPVEIDGEFSGFTPLRVTVIPHAIQMVI